MSSDAPAAAENENLSLSLGEHGQAGVTIPTGSWLRRMFAFAGPAYMVSVGYMDPGNWATDLEGGARFGYRLIWVLLMSNLIALLLQTLATRLGVVSGRDLAQACREAYPRPVRYVLFGLCEIAIAACDLAEVLGTAIGINLLSSLVLPRAIPLEGAIWITACDVLVLLAIQRLGIRKMEAFIVSLVSIIGLCFIVELFLAKPDAAAAIGGLVPSKLRGDSLYVAIGIIGATVMPHNLYLHSALVQSRRHEPTEAGIRQSLRFNLWDASIALNCAFLVNAAILILAAATFWARGQVVTEIGEAYQLLSGLLGSKVAPIAFAVALICAGQSSTITGTLAGQITMEGFLHFRMRPWLRRLITRVAAVAPALIVIHFTGASGTTRLLILSQVILSLQLPFAIVPLVKFTGHRDRMGMFASPPWLQVIAWIIATVIIGLNVQLVMQQIAQWGDAAGPHRALVLGVSCSAAALLGGLLLWMIFRREPLVRTAAAGAQIDAMADAVAHRAVALLPKVSRIGVSLEATTADGAMLAYAISLAKTHGATLILIHIVEGAAAQYYGAIAGDAERASDDRYLSDLAIQLRATSPDLQVAPALGFGDVRREIIRLAREQKLDMLILGSHGHRGLSDIIRGSTIDAVRHKLPIPVLAVR